MNFTKTFLGHFFSGGGTRTIRSIASWKLISSFGGFSRLVVMVAMGLIFFISISAFWASHCYGSGGNVKLFNTLKYRRMMGFGLHSLPASSLYSMTHHRTMEYSSLDTALSSSGVTLLGGYPTPAAIDCFGRRSTGALTKRYFLGTTSFSSALDRIAK